MCKKNYYQSGQFSIDLSSMLSKTTMTMRMHVPIANTRDVPGTRDFLHHHFPSVLSTTCFNRDHIPFAEEVQHTELGHLFEHILLDQLCIAKLTDGCDEAVYNGVTSWNWIKEETGVFHITVDIGRKEFRYFIMAFKETVRLLEQLIATVPSLGLGDTRLPHPTTGYQSELQVRPAFRN